MLQNFKLSSKFNIMLVSVFFAGIIFSGIALSAVLSKNSEDQIVSKALILIQTMNSVRNYTSTQIIPKLSAQLETETDFLPQTIPAYSAREVFENLRTSNPEYREFFYKEATLNPTNLRDKADNFETDIVQKFRNDASLKELSGFRNFPGGDLFYIARPIPIKQQTCLRCHSTPEVAPKSMINTYGRDNGFGWKLDEIIGAQIISVPAKEIVNAARQSLILVMVAVALVFILTLLLINLLLKQAVIKPLNRMAYVADAVSKGNMDAEFQQNSRDEIGVLASAFNRMKLSLAMAMDLLNKP